jgi:hypothetical protein
LGVVVIALADTAALVATLELKDKFSKTAKSAETSLDRLTDKTTTLGRVGSDVGRGLGAAATNLTRLGVIGIGFLGANVAAGIQSLQRLEEVTTATNAVIASTGGVAGVTAKQVRDLAEEYENLNATMDDKVIQSGENLLLTFTSINKDAFQPALEAALNLNQAMGGGEEGLQGTIIQVGKALQDPVRGLTALRRVGVNFTKAQEDQIKALVEANDLYGAQKIVLAELSREFGGQFAAAGQTATAKFAKFKDTIEDSQMALATAFLPALVRVSDKLNTLLADPATQAAISNIGQELADAFDSLVALVGNLPWTSIGDAFRLMGTGSKALLDAFVGLPPWVQTAVLTGWGLNKLTGGALGSIVSTLATGLIKGILGITAGVVNINAGIVNGPGLPGGKGPGLPPIIGKPPGVGLLKGLLGPAFLGLTIAELTGNRTELTPEIQAQAIADALRSGTPIEVAVAGRTRESIEQVLHGDPNLQVGLTDQQIQSLRDLVGEVDRIINVPEGGRGAKGAPKTSPDDPLLTQTRQQHKEQQATVFAQGMRDYQQQLQLQGNLKQAAAERRAEAARLLQNQAQSLMSLQTIASKNFSPIIKVGVTSSVSISDVQRRITSMQIAIGRGFQEFE